MTLSIYDALGREVATLVDEALAPGRYEATWEASQRSSGLYLARLSMGTQVSVRRLVLMK